jgi:glycosyltransferase involved in cell wall biosynthesis
MSENTGIGVVQRNLYRELSERGVALTLGPARDAPAILGPVGRLIRALAGQTASADVRLLTAPPAPLRVQRPLVSIVYDVRWTKTRRYMARAYRAADLWRTMRVSSAVLTISHRSYDDIVSFAGDSPKLRVIAMGPGIMDNAERSVERSTAPADTLLLVGKAPHKRNELAAEAIAHRPPPWLRKVTTVDVSAGCRETLDSMSGVAKRHYGTVTVERMRELYRSAAYFLLLSTSEGFGFPYVEATFGGSHVIAVRQPLTEEIFQGQAATLLEDGDLSHISEQLQDVEAGRNLPSDSWFERFSWSAAADQTLEVLRQVV